MELLPRQLRRRNNRRFCLWLVKWWWNTSHLCSAILKMHCTRELVINGENISLSISTKDNPLRHPSHWIRVSNVFILSCCMRLKAMMIHWQKKKHMTKSFTDFHIYFSKKLEKKVLLGGGEKLALWLTASKRGKSCWLRKQPMKVIYISLDKGVVHNKIRFQIYKIVML